MGDSVDYDRQNPAPPSCPLPQEQVHHEWRKEDCLSLERERYAAPERHPGEAPFHGCTERQYTGRNPKEVRLTQCGDIQDHARKQQGCQCFFERIGARERAEQAEKLNTKAILRRRER